jgi:hypothetical protein
LDHLLDRLDDEPVDQEDGKELAKHEDTSGIRP